MSGVLSALSWVISNWQMLATCASSAMSIALFFMHGNSKASIQELRDFINSIHVSQSPESAQQVSEQKNPKI